MSAPTITAELEKVQEALRFYANGDYHFDAFSNGARELFDDEGDRANEAITALDTVIARLEEQQVKGDAFTRKDEAAQALISSPAKYAEAAVSEILGRLVAEEAIDCLTINVEQIVMLLRPYLQATLPPKAEQGDVVERVAIAISQWRNDCNLGEPTWPRLRDAEKAAYREQAEAAIAALTAKE